MQNRPRIDRVLSHAVTIAALAYSASQVLDAPFDGRTLLLAAGAVVLFSAGLELRVDNSRRHSAGLARSMHPTVAMLLLFLVGPWMAMLAAATASAVHDVRTRRSIRKLVGNIGTRAVPLAWAGWAWIAFGGGEPGLMHLPNDYVPLGATMFVYAAMHELGFVVDAMAANTARWARWRDEVSRFPSNLGSTLLQAFVGGGIGALCLDNPWAAPVVVPIAASAFLAMERGNRVREVTDRALDTFARIVDERDTYTFEHSDRVCEYALCIGVEMGLSERELEALYWTSRLHDLGKVAIDNSILNKPGSLTADEFRVMQQHPETSARILASFSFDDYDTEVVRCHHERFDGRGYLRRERSTVPMEAFIIAVADSFDAMTSSRPYRAALAREVALEEIVLGIGSQFHPEPAKAFLRIMNHRIDLGHDAGVTAIVPAGEEAGAGPVRRQRVDLGDDFREAA